MEKIDGCKKSLVVFFWFVENRYKNLYIYRVIFLLGVWVLSRNFYINFGEDISFVVCFMWYYLVIMY